MERLVFKAYQGLVQEFDVAFVGPDGAEDYIEPKAALSCCRPTPVSRFLLEVQWKAVRMAGRLKPDLVIGGSGLVAHAVRAAAWFAGAKSMCYVHGLDLVAKSAVYRRAFIPAIASCDCLLANSNNTAHLAQAAGVQKEKLKIIHPGTDLPRIDHVAARSDFRASLGVDDQAPLLLSVGRLTRRKGLVEFIERVLPNLTNRFPGLKLIVVGAEPIHAVKKDSVSHRDLLSSATKHGVEKALVLLGEVNDAALSAAYTAADLLIFPVLPIAGDVEGFGMVAIEAAAHGLPTVAFAVGGVSDAVRDGVSGYLVQPLCYADMEQIIINHITAEKTFDLRPSCVRFASTFSWSRFSHRLHEICREVMSDSPTTDH